MIYLGLVVLDLLWGWWWLLMDECVNCGMDWNVGVGQCEESSWLGG